MSMNINLYEFLLFPRFQNGSIIKIICQDKEGTDFDTGSDSELSTCKCLPRALENETPQLLLTQKMPLCKCPKPNEEKRKIENEKWFTSSTSYTKTETDELPLEKLREPPLKIEGGSQNKNGQRRSIESRKSQDQNGQRKSIESRKSQEQNAQRRSNESRKSQDQNAQKRSNESRKSQDQNAQRRSNESRKSQDQNGQRKSNESRKSQDQNGPRRSYESRKSQDQNVPRRSLEFGQNGLKKSQEKDMVNGLRKFSPLPPISSKSSITTTDKQEEETVPDKVQKGTSISSTNKSEVEIQSTPYQMSSSEGKSSMEKLLEPLKETLTPHLTIVVKKPRNSLKPGNSEESGNSRNKSIPSKNDQLLDKQVATGTPYSCKNCNCDKNWKNDSPLGQFKPSDDPVKKSTVDNATNNVGSKSHNNEEGKRLSQQSGKRLDYKNGGDLLINNEHETKSSITYEKKRTDICCWSLLNRLFSKKNSKSEKEALKCSNTGLRNRKCPNKSDNKSKSGSIKCVKTGVKCTNKQCPCVEHQNKANKKPKYSCNFCKSTEKSQPDSIIMCYMNKFLCLLRKYLDFLFIGFHLFIMYVNVLWP